MKQNFSRWVVWYAFLALGPLAALAAEERDRFGGWSGVSGNATGFFHTEEISNVWWFITPEGKGFYSKGVNTVSYTADFCPALDYHPYGRVTAAKYGSAEKWAQATAARLREWNFNTLSAWSSPEMFEQHLPYTLILNAAEAGGANWQRGDVADVFSPAFEQRVIERARKVCAPHADDPYLLGYFTDNELRWTADWRSQTSLFEIFFAKPLQSAGKLAALRVVRGEYGDIADFNKAWGMVVGSWDSLAMRRELPMHSAAAKRAENDFLHAYARAYFTACRAAIRAVDRHHLILGCRFAGKAPPEVLRAMHTYVDVVSFNNYSATLPEDQLREVFQTAQRPVLVSEFGFKAMDSGLPNTRGAGKPLPTQQDRAQHFEQYATAVAKLPFAVGYHWFEYADEPAQGRFDGENSDYGLVNIQDEPWQTLVERMTRVNFRIEEIHLQGKPAGP